jgi:(2Fe-2S) ferredoxin
MSSYSQPAVPFQVIGEFLGFVIKDGYKVKYLKISVDGREYWFKPEKSLREQLSRDIPPRASLKVTGESQFCGKTGKLKLRVTELEPLGDGSGAIAGTGRTKKASVLVCEKSDCWKNGGAIVCRALEEGLRDRGLSETVALKRTGCLKQCGNGPNLVVMPDKKHYRRVDPRQIPALLDRHFVSL